MAASAIPAQPAPRIQSVDALRGAIMILMAIDHIRDYIARSAMQFYPPTLGVLRRPFSLLAGSPISARRFSCSRPVSAHFSG